MSAKPKGIKVLPGFGVNLSGKRRVACHPLANGDFLLVFARPDETGEHVTQVRISPDALAGMGAVVLSTLRCQPTSKLALAIGESEA